MKHAFPMDAPLKVMTPSINGTRIWSTWTPIKSWSITIEITDVGALLVWETDSRARNFVHGYAPGQWLEIAP